MEYLCFRLYGPFASWGEIAVGESRHSAVYPGKSALLGLLAAALGIKRDEEEMQLALAAGYQFAVKVLRTGSLLCDYHTTQVPPSAALHRAARTRREELYALKQYIKTGVKVAGTILSSREYRCDAHALVAVRATEAAPYPLTELFNALLKPKFHLYLGRKSCPLAAPLAPHIEQCEGFGQALDSMPVKPLASENTDHRWLAAEVPARYYWEGNAYDLQAQQTLTRHDQPLSRTRWQFTRRSENLCLGNGGD